MHDHGTGRRLKVSALATAAFVVVEFGIGWWANSLALISDAGHNFSDMLALILSAWAFAMSSHPADSKRTFGYHRVGVLAALVNALTLIVLAGYIFFEGYQRLIHPEPVASLPMIVVALVAVAYNGGVVLLLRRASAGDVNVRSAFVHMAGDAISAVGVVLAGLGVLLTGSSLWDPAVSLLIGVFIVWSSLGIIRETINILLEGTPQGLEMDAVARDIERVPGVRSVHDLHSWTLGANVRALSAHIEITNPIGTTANDIVAIVRRVKSTLAERHGIAHATIETHCSDCDSRTVACDITPSEAHDHDHAGHHQ